MQATEPKPSQLIAALPVGLNPDSVESMRQFARSHDFPSATNDGRFLFAFVDEAEYFASVQLRHGLAGHRKPITLHRCAGGLHVVKVAAPFVNRIEYRFATIDEECVESIVNDPLNPHSVRDPFATKSVIATSSYTPPRYIAAPPAQARGELVELSIDGPIGKPWPTWAWSPPRFKSTDMLPVIVFLDGGDWLQLAGARNILENLTFNREITPCRAVFVKPASRNEEYAVNPHTAAFLADAFAKAIAAHMPWPHKPRDRIAVGCSLAGLCLLHAHFLQPKTFGGLILQSGSFFQPRTDAMESDFPWFGSICDFVSRALGNAPQSVPRIPIHMTAGRGEENYVNNAILAQSLTRQGFALSFHEQPDAHNWTCWRDCIGEGLRRLLAP